MLITNDEIEEKHSASEFARLKNKLVKTEEQINTLTSSEAVNRVNLPSRPDANKIVEKIVEKKKEMINTKEFIAAELRRRQLETIKSFKKKINGE